MPRICQLTRKRPLKGFHVSHAHNKTKRRQYPNLKTRRLFVEDLGRSVRLKLSTKALKTISKIGLNAMLKKEGLRPKDLV